MPSPVTAAIAALEEQRTKLRTDLEALDSAITALQGVNGAAAPKRARHAKRRTSVNRSAKITISDAAVRAALKGGPRSTREFSEALEISAYQRGVLLKDLSKRGIVVVTGTTADRRIALAGSPAKEAP